MSIGSPAFFLKSRLKVLKMYPKYGIIKQDGRKRQKPSSTGRRALEARTSWRARLQTAPTEVVFPN